MIGISACRDADKRLESEVRAAIEAGDIPALTARDRLPVAVNILSHGIYSRVFADLLAGGYVLPLRTMRGLQLGETHRTYTKAQTIRRLRATTGHKAEVIRALLTGEGDRNAVTLRALAEAVRGAPLPVYDLSEASGREPVLFEQRSASSKRAAATRVQRHGVSGTPRPKNPKATRAERTAAAIAARSAKQLERDAARERRREARLRKRRECSEADELEPRLSYRDRIALESGQQ